LAIDWGCRGKFKGTLVVCVTLLICSGRREKGEEVFGVTFFFLFLNIGITIGILAVTVEGSCGS